MPEALAGAVDHADPLLSQTRAREVPRGGGEIPNGPDHHEPFRRRPLDQTSHGLDVLRHPTSSRH